MALDGDTLSQFVNTVRRDVRDRLIPLVKAWLKRPRVHTMPGSRRP